MFPNLEEKMIIMWVKIITLSKEISQSSQINQRVSEEPESVLLSGRGNHAHLLCCSCGTWIRAGLHGLINSTRSIPKGANNVILIDSCCKQSQAPATLHTTTLNVKVSPRTVNVNPCRLHSPPVKRERLSRHLLLQLAQNWLLELFKQTSRHRDISFLRGALSQREAC